MKFVALKDSYKELPLSHAMLLGQSEKKVKKTCALDGCEKPVSQRGIRAKYCSLYCSVKARTKVKHCELKECGKEFHPYRASMSFCSRACYLKSVQPPDRFCLNKTCGIKLHEQEKYCSLKCCYEHKHGHLEWNDVCQRPGCEKELIDNRSSRKYCSQECYNIVREHDKNSTGKIKLVKRKGWTYPRRFIKTESGWKLLSVFTWETHNGPLPTNHIITFNDGDSFNDQDINNLCLVSAIENLLIKRGLRHASEEATPASKETFSAKDNIVI